MDFDRGKFEIRSFVAGSVLEAANKIRAELGPDAIVLDIRQIKPDGIAKLWKKPKIEVLACRPNGKSDNIKSESDKKLEILQSEIEKIKLLLEEKSFIKEVSTDENLPRISGTSEEISDPSSPWGETLSCNLENGFLQDFYLEEAEKGFLPFKYNFNEPQQHQELKEDNNRQGVETRSIAITAPSQSDWKVNLLQNIGIESCYIPLILEQWKPREDKFSNENVRYLMEILKKIWKRGSAVEFTPGKHFFVGPPGSGKSAVIGKIASRLVLNESASVSIVRFDGIKANTSELPLIYSEILGIPYSKEIPDSVIEEEYLLIDIPGSDYQSSDDMNFLLNLRNRHKNAKFHLVLNICYDTRLLLNQIRAFKKIGSFDVIFTHIDEEPRPGKLINFKLGTNYTVSFLAGGQNIPGILEKGDSTTLLNRIFSLKTA